MSFPGEAMGLFAGTQCPAGLASAASPNQYVTERRRHTSKHLKIYTNRRRGTCEASWRHAMPRHRTPVVHQQETKPPPASSTNSQSMFR